MMLLRPMPIRVTDRRRRRVGRDPEDVVVRALCHHRQRYEATATVRAVVCVAISATRPVTIATQTRRCGTGSVAGVHVDQAEQLVTAGEPADVLHHPIG